jgi:hypothetical protein
MFINGCSKPYSGQLNRYLVTARASTQEDVCRSAEAAFDGHRETRWSSAFNDREWIQARFSEPVTLERIVIHWEKARAAAYTVYALQDGQWLRIAERVQMSGTTDDIQLGTPISTVGIRIECAGRATQWGYSIFEIECFGITQAKPPDTSLLDWVCEPPAEEIRIAEPEPTPSLPPVVTATPAPQVVPAATPPPEEPAPVPTNLTMRLLAEAASDPATSEGMTDEEFLELVARRTFYYFWYESDPETGLTRDRGRNFESSEELKHSSIAATGFALAAYPVAVERGWISRAQAVDRVRRTLRTFDEGKVRNIHGFFPHFVDMKTGKDCTNTEISTIDTALLLAGMIVSMEYFNDPEIYQRAQRIFNNVDWKAGSNGHDVFVSHGWHQDGKPIHVHWCSFSEGILIYPIAVGSRRHGLSSKSWYAIDRHRGVYAGYEFIVEHGFQSIFRYQYPALFLDFERWTDRSGIDYYANVRTAVLAMRAYCIDKAGEFPDSYGPDMWGLGAADGPGNRYYIYGFPPGSPYSPTDGSVIPYAIAGSIPFLPKHSIRALRHLYDHYHESWGKYGFADCVNPSQNFIASDVLGLDAGTILLGIENYRSGMIWKLFMRNRWIQRAIQRMGWKKKLAARDPRAPLDLVRYGSWRLHKGDGADFMKRRFDDTDWIPIVMPDRWEDSSPFFQGYDGIGWYRCTFNIRQSRFMRWLSSGEPLSLVIGGIDDADAVWFNGKPVGRTEPGPDIYRQQRVYRIPNKLFRRGKNIIAVRVIDKGGSGGIWKPPVTIGPQ